MNMNEVSSCVIQFKSVFAVKDIAEAWYKFLKKEFNNENWDFVLSVQELDKISKKQHKKIFKHVELIVTLFIAENSQKEIITGNVQKKLILEEFAKLSKTSWNINYTPSELFEPLQKMILMEYKNDAFKRFTRTEECLKLVEKHQKNRNVLQPQLSVLYNYSGVDFDQQPITKKDIKFLNQFEEDNPNWILEYEDKKNNVLAFKSNWNYFPNVEFIGSSISNIRIQIIFDFPLQQVACAMFGKYQNHDPFATKSRVCEYKFNESVVVEQNSIFGFFQEPRIKKILYSMEYDAEKKKITCRGKPYKMEGIPFLENTFMNIVAKKGEKEQKMKAIQYFSFYVNSLTQIDENRTLFQHTAMVDLGGTGFPKGITTKRAQGIQANTAKYLSTMGDKITIKDHKYEFNELWEGLPVDPLAKLLYDLDIDGIDEQYQQKMKKRKEIFNISNYMLYFTCLENKEIEKAYFKFLQSEQNETSWEFLKEVKKLKFLHEKQKFELESLLLKEIIETFILVSSPKDLFIAKEDREEIVSKVQNRNKNFPSFKFFDKISQQLRMEHQMEYFKRFGKSSIAKDVLAKYQYDGSVMAPIAGILSEYKSEHFQTKNITTMDFEFVYSILSHSSTWDSVLCKKEYQISVSNVNWFPKVDFISSSVVSYVFEYIFNSSFENVVNSFFNLKKMNKIDPNVTKSKVIAQTEGEDLNLVVLEHEMIWTWGNPLSRKSVSTIVSHGNSLLFISKPIYDQKETFEVPQYFHYEIYILSEKNGKSKLKNIICVDSNEKNWEKPMIERAKTFQTSLLENVRNVSLRTEKELEIDPLRKMAAKVLLNRSLQMSEESDETLSETNSFEDDSDLTSFIETE
jgi:hypothetical protein